MARFLAQRLLNYVALCLVATFLAFALAAFTLDPIERYRQANPPPPQSSIDAKRAELHLDDAIPLRFVNWMGGALQGDFGKTVVNSSISEELPRRIGVSLRLFLLGTTIGIGLGVIIGVASAIRQYKFSDYAATFFSFVLLSTPVFLLALLLKQVALEVNTAAGAQLLAFTGETTPGFQGGFWATVGDRLRNLILPTLTITLGQIAFYSRYQRSAMLDVLGSDFLRTAQAKGLTRRKALFKHGLRTALVPMATLFAFGFGLLITGGTFTERIFAWYGMGDWLVYGIQQQDTNLIATVTLFVAVLVLVSGWLSDVFYALLDPRVRLR